MSSEDIFIAHLCNYYNCFFSANNCVLPSQCNKQHSSLSKNQQQIWVMERLPLTFWCGTFPIVLPLKDQYAN